MISRIRGTLIHRDTDRIEVATPGGVVYEIFVPLSILERLPRPPKDDFEIRTLQVVREDSATLYGFAEGYERELFGRLMVAKGVGPSLAVSLLSTFAAPRLARALVEKDVNALKQVSGVGKKTAERIILDLADRVTDLAARAPEGDGERPGGRVAQEAVAALQALGYGFADADEAVRAALEQGEPEGTDQLVRRALAGR